MSELGPEEKLEQEARRRGVDALLHKPVRLPEIARVVRRLIDEVSEA